MRKIYSLLTAGLLLAGFSTAKAIDLPTGQHTFTADVEYTEDYEWVKDVTSYSFTLDFEKCDFTITSNSIEGWLKSNLDQYTTYDSATGTLKFRDNANNIIGYVSTSDYMHSGNLAIADAAGNFENPATVCFTVDADGHITIPDFTLVNTYKSNAIAVKFTNCKIDGWPEDGGTEEPAGDPKLVLGTYNFNADVTYEPGYDKLAEYLNAFPHEVTLGGSTARPSLENWVKPQFSEWMDYNASTGELTFTRGNIFGFMSDYAGFQVGMGGLADADGTYVAPPTVAIKTDAEGNLTIPSFTMVDIQASNKVVARFNNPTFTLKDGSEEPEEPEVPSGEFKADNGEKTIEGTEVIGKYIIKADSYKGIFDVMSGSNKEAVEIEIEVRADEGDANNALSYYVVETGEGNYLNGNIIPFEYGSGSKLATFNQFYAGKAGEVPVFFSAMLKPELQGQYGWTFTAEDGFTFNGQNGWCWIESKKDTGLDPADSYATYGVYVLTGCEVIADEPAPAFPTAEELVGNYKLECSDYELYEAGKDFAEYLPETIYFSITYINEELYINDFITGTTKLKYDQNTGLLEMNATYGRAGGITTNQYLYYAPEDGGYTAMSGANANYLQFKVDENGTITVENFDVLNSSRTAKVAKYYNCTISAIDESEVPKSPNDPKDWQGTYHFSGTKYNYTDGAETSTEALEFDLVIDEKNRITAIAGYTVPEINLGSDDLLGWKNQSFVEAIESGYTVNAYYSNGVEFKIQADASDDDQNRVEGLVFGDGNTTEWNQDEPAIVLTPNDDEETYTLAPFTIWNMHYVFDQAAQNGDGAWVRTYDLVFKWDDTPYVAPAEPINPPAEVEGMWEFTEWDHYGSSAASGSAVAYKAEIIGKEVLFTNEWDEPLIAQFFPENKVRFSKVNTDPQATVKFPRWQVPFIYTTLTNDIEVLFDEYQVPYIEAEYDATEGTLTFPANSGILYSHLTVDGEFTSGTGFNAYSGYHEAAFDLTAPARKVGEIKPTIEISTEPGWFTVKGNDIEVTVDVTLEGFTFLDAKDWKVNLSETGNDGVEDSDWTKESVIDDVEVAAGTATFTISDLEAGNHDFMFTLEAFDADGESIAVSNGKALTTKIGGEITIIKSSNTVENGAIKVEFRHIISGIDLDNATFKARFIDHATIDEDTNPNGTPVDVETLELDHDAQTGVARLEDQPSGTYSHYVQLVAFNNEGKEIAASNRLDITSVVETTGVADIIDNIEAGQARYFNLQGVEIRNPQPGTIVIKVTDGKAQKILVK